MSLRKSAVSGTIWTTASFGVQAVIQVLRLSILTRFLDKSDFGLVAIVVLILGFTKIFADLGVSTSLFSRERITKKEYSSLYWVSMLLGVFLYVLLVVSSPYIASFYGLPSLTSLIPLMGLDLIISTGGRQFRVFRQKALQFRFLAIVDIVSAVLSIGIAIALAYADFGVYSMIYSSVFASLVSTLTLIAFGLKEHPILFYLNFKEGRSFYKIGFYQTGSQILDYLSSQLDILIIGKMMPVGDLGVYNLIKQLVLRIYSVTNPILTSVATPLLAKLQSNSQELKNKTLNLISMVTLINAPIYAILAIMAPEILKIIYGQQYVNSASILQLLSLWGVFTSIASVSSIVVVVTGRTDLGLKWTIFRVLYNPVFVILGSFWALKGIVFGQVFYALSILPLYWYILVRKVMPSIGFLAYIQSIFGILSPAIMVCFLIIIGRIRFLSSYIDVWMGLVSVLLFLAIYSLFNFERVRDIRELLFRKNV